MGRGLSKTGFVPFNHMESVGFADVVKADVCVSIGQPENKLSTCAARSFLSIKTCSVILCQPVKILASLLSLPVKAKHVDGFVVRELKVNSRNCVRER